MTHQHLPPHDNIAPPAEPFTSLADTVHDTAEDVVLRVRRTRRRRIVALVAAVGLVAAVLATLLAVRTDKPATGAMTQDLAVSFVQSEFPAKFKDPAKLIVLFEATCNVRQAGGTRADAILPLLEADLSQQEAAYIYDMSVRSTCPKYV